MLTKILIYPKRKSAISLKLTIVVLKITVGQEAGAYDLYANGDVSTLVKLGPIALVSKNKLTSTSGEEKRLIDNADNACSKFLFNK